MMQTDVKAATCGAGATTVFNGPARVKGLTVSFATGGTIVIADGTITKFTYTAPAAAGTINIVIPGEGVRCDTSVIATCTSATAVVFYG